MVKSTALLSAALSLFLAVSLPLTDALELEMNEDSNYNWFGMTANREGNQLNAITFRGDIFRSETGGRNWVQSTHFEERPMEGKNFVDITSNGKGDKIYSVEYNGGIWKSENGGIDWEVIPETNEKAWSAIATNEEGNILIAAVDAGNIWVSNDYGRTWSEKTNYSSDENHPWIKVACNLKGDKMTAIADKGGLYTSSDFGETWEENTNFDKTFRWCSVDMNDDGSHLYATTLNQIWTSNDFGKTWTERKVQIPEKEEEGEKSLEATFSYISCNGKGNTVTFASEYDNIYISNDYGVTFSPVFDSEVGNDFPWAHPVVNKNGIGITLAQAPGITFFTRTENQLNLVHEKNNLVIENVNEIGESLDNFVMKEVEGYQEEMDEKQKEELKDSIDDIDREIYGMENLEFEKVGVEERDMDKVFAEIIENANVNLK